MAKRKNRQDAQQLAYDLFMTTNKDQKEIATIVGFSEQTITAWKQKGNWEDLKLAHQNTRDENVKQLQLMLKKVIEQNQVALDKGELTAADIDKQHKIAATIDKLSQEVPLRMYVQCFEDFIAYIRGTSDKELIEEIMALQYQFLTDKANG